MLNFVERNSIFCASTIKSIYFVVAYQILFKMKLKVIFYCFISLLLLQSCIKDEAMYREADIESFDLNNPVFVQALPERNNIIDVIVADTTGMYLKKFAPVFVLSPKATSDPQSGDSVLFEDYKTSIKVLSEDQSLERYFMVRLVQIVPLSTGFEEWTTSGGGLLIHPAVGDNLWNTANSGIALATMGKIGEYPTRPTNDARSGEYAALLETKKGGTYWGQKIPIFSGSLFRGKFTLNIGNFVKSAKFGQIHPEYMGKPKMFKGYYKYTPGETFIDEQGDEVPGRIDECSIHSVLYRIDKGDISDDNYLTGENVLTSDRIVARAVLGDSSAKSEYTEFSIPFVYEGIIDYEKYDYRLAVVFASSKEGDFYRGAVGSKLIVDDVEIVCEQWD